MKRILILLTMFVLFIVPSSTSALAISSDNQTEAVTSVELLPNGDYIITELALSKGIVSTYSVNGSTIPGRKTATYYSSNGTKIWDVTVNGTFTYTYGVSATSTSSSATVNIYNAKAKFVSKSANTSGNTATATGTVTYNSLSTTKSVSISCDKYGNLY